MHKRFIRETQGTIEEKGGWGKNYNEKRERERENTCTILDHYNRVDQGRIARKGYEGSEL